jgi:hypothetical protein
MAGGHRTTVASEAYLQRRFPRGDRSLCESRAVPRDSRATRVLRGTGASTTGYAGERRGTPGSSHVGNRMNRAA